jgi:geranylgeranyl pyrophosphate synthase
MDMHSEIVTFLLEMPLIRGWPEMQSLLQRAAARKPRDWRLPVIAGEAVGGDLESVIPAAAAVACAQISIILVDDLLDDDPRGEYRRIGAAQAANLALAFQAAGTLAIARSGVEVRAMLQALERFSQMMLATALGQHWDIQNPDDEEGYWRLVRTKSAPFYGTAWYLGAILGGTSNDLAEALERTGRLYGEMIQIHDDLHDTMEVPANPDWLLRRSPLPILFAQTVAHPDRARFLQLREAIQEPGALAEAQTILIRCGAVSYCIHELLARYHRAVDALAGTPLVRRSELENLLNAQVKPVHDLFAAMGLQLGDIRSVEG